MSRCPCGAWCPNVNAYKLGFAAIALHRVEKPACTTSGFHCCRNDLPAECSFSELIIHAGINASMEHDTSNWVIRKRAPFLSSQWTTCTRFPAQYIVGTWSLWAASGIICRQCMQIRQAASYPLERLRDVRHIFLVSTWTPRVASRLHFCHTVRFLGYI